MNVHWITIKKIHLSLLPLFVTRTRKERRRKRNLGMRMSTSFLARWISTRRGMASEVGNPGHNSVVRGRWEAANAFKVSKELNKRKYISPWGRRTEKVSECWKDFWMLKTWYQKWRRFEEMNKIVEDKRSRGRMWRRDRDRGGWWHRSRPGTLRLWNSALRLLRRRRIYKNLEIL